MGAGATGGEGVGADAGLVGVPAGRFVASSLGGSVNWIFVGVEAVGVAAGVVGVVAGAEAGVAAGIVIGGALPCCKILFSNSLVSG